MKRVTTEQGLSSAVAGGKVAVLFHATWCPYCGEFRPEFRRLMDAQPAWTAVECILDDEDNPLWESHAIEVVPTVVFFERGKPVGRLDGRLGVGLTRTDLAHALK